MTATISVIHSGKNDMLYFRNITASFSTIGLILGLTFFCISLTPSLLPRDHIVQGVLSGVVFATGYGIGRLGHWVWKFMELEDVRGRLARIVLWTLVSILTLTAIATLNQIITWQNSIRLRMEMTPVETFYLVTLCGIAIITAMSVIFLMRLLIYAMTKMVDAINRYLPRRIAVVLGSTVFIVLLLSFVNGVIVKGALHMP
ncbi:MAG: hypothetical protein OEL68_08280, partial [Desulfobulbaceae bacterium]|nr:hypothetical protein [Desulfobulbaceae bacterium]